MLISTAQLLSGERGDNGTAGAKGNAGTVGVPGPRGVNGSRGADGDKGMPGENTRGPPGPAGPPGTETEKEVLMTMLTRALFSHSMYALSNKIRSFLCTTNS